MNKTKIAMISLLAIFIVSIIASSAMAAFYTPTVVKPVNQKVSTTATPTYTVTHLSGLNGYWMPYRSVGKLELSKVMLRQPIVVVRPAGMLNTKYQTPNTLV